MSQREAADRATRGAIHLFLVTGWLGVPWLPLLFFLSLWPLNVNVPGSGSREKLRGAVSACRIHQLTEMHPVYISGSLVDLDGGQQLATQPLWVFNQQCSQCTCAVKAYPDPTCPLCTIITKSPCWPLISNKALVCFLGRLQSGFTALKRLGDQRLT